MLLVLQNAVGPTLSAFGCGPTVSVAAMSRSRSRNGASAWSHDAHLEAAAPSSRVLIIFSLFQLLRILIELI